MLTTAPSQKRPATKQQGKYRRKNGARSQTWTGTSYSLNGF